MKHRPILPILLALFVVAAVSRRKHHMWDAGSDRPKKRVPPIFEEWHRRLHESDQAPVL
ncbi:MAG: hypothetical protein ACM3JD_06115 [Rudaea sp.]